MKIIGTLFILLGVGLGLYVGVWWGLVMGITAIVESAQAPVDAFGIGLNVVRVLFASTLGGIVFWALSAIGFAAINAE